MQILKTPEECFSGIRDFPHEPNYLSVDDGQGGKLQMHYVDAGPKKADGETILCLHGQPTWSYLYRHMIPIFTDAGYRVIAPDLVGFGKSDKPTEREDYSYASHVGWIGNFLRRLNLNNLTLVGQDWGGLIGLRAVADCDQLFARVVTANTGLPDARGIPDDMAPVMRQMLEDTPALPVLEMARRLAEKDGDRPGFLYWIKHCAEREDFSPAEVVALSLRNCTDETRAAYAAPFPSEEYLQGARQFPSLVPLFPDDPAILANRAAWTFFRNFKKPFLTAFSDSDPVTAGQHKRFQEEIPGARNQHHVTIEGAGHFLQEDAATEFAEAVIRFVAANPL